MSGELTGKNTKKFVAEKWQVETLRKEVVGVLTVLSAMNATVALYQEDREEGSEDKLLCAITEMGTMAGDRLAMLIRHLDDVFDDSLPF